MRFYMYFTILAALAASTISPTLSAPTHYGYANLFVEFISQAFPEKWNSSGSLGPNDPNDPHHTAVPIIPKHGL